MVLTDNVMEELQRIERERPHAVRSTLRVGDEVSRNFHRGSFVFRMDDLEVYKALGAFADDTSFYLAIENQFRVMVTDDYLRVFPSHEREGTSIIAPFSRPVHARVGDVLAKSVLVQLAKQNATVSFLVYGLFSHDQAPRTTAHAYNILFANDRPRLIDAQNPMIVGQARQVVPYEVPIFGIDANRIVIEEKWRAGRNYAIAPKGL